MNIVTSQSGGRLGRPTREESQRRQERLLDIALDHFQDKGFEQATVEAITLAANMSKRTVYQRYPDKMMLFHATVRRAVRGRGVGREALDTITAATLEERLVAAALLFCRDLATPRSLAFQRLLHREAHRLMPIAAQLYDAHSALTSYLAKQIAGHAAPGTIAHDHPIRAAEAFMSVTMSAITRVFVSGATMSDKDIEERVRLGTRLFLEGVKTA